MQIPFLLLILAAGQGVPGTGQSPAAAAPGHQCAAEARSAAPAPGPRTHFDPLLLDLNGAGRQSAAAAPGGSTGAQPGGGAAGIAITEEGGPNQHADRPKPKGLSAQAPGDGASAGGGGQVQQHAISTKGTGAAGRSDAATSASSAKEGKGSILPATTPGGPVTMSGNYRQAAVAGTCPAPATGIVKKSKSNISTN
jgi:hypothetical protein